MRITRQLISCLLFTLCVLPRSYSQQRYQLGGQILMPGSSAALPGATVSVSGAGQRISGKDGRFIFLLPQGEYRLQITHIGFDTLRTVVKLQSDTSLRYSLIPSGNLMHEVRISGSRGNHLSRDVQNMQQITREDLDNLPSFMGQKDLIRAVQSLPGVSSGGDGNSGLFVRGGTSGQNLILLNGATVYNPAHLLGFFSVFNSDAIDHLELYTSGIPAEYGGCLSSVLEAVSPQQKVDSASLNGSLSPLSANLNLRLPVTKNWSVSTSLRKTFMNVTVWPLLNRLNLTSGTFKKMNYDFYDFNLTSNAQLSPKDKLNFSLYTGGDNFGFGAEHFSIANRMDWGNTAASLQWTRQAGKRGVAEQLLTYSSYDFNFGMEQNQLRAGVTSMLKDYTYKNTFSYYLSRHKIKGGIEYARHRMSPNTPSVSSSGTELDFGAPNTYTTGETALFAGDEMSISPRLSVYAGIRYTYYRYYGTDTLTTGRQSGYSFAEPRLLLRYGINEQSALKFSYTRNVQALHLISVTAVNFPADFRMPSLPGLPPEKGWQVSGGYYTGTGENRYEASADIYYKSMDRLPEFSGGIMNMLDNLKIEENLLSGRGNAYGSEFYVHKKYGRLTGRAAYTLSWSRRRFDGINNGKAFPAKYDRRHQLSLTAAYRLSPKWSLSGAFVYTTGNAYTAPVSRYIISGNIVNEYGPYNGSRMPAYHRLDIGANYILKQTARTKSSLSFSVYNLYNRQNPVSIYFMVNGNLEDYQVSVTPERVSLLPVLPCISWSFSFK